MSEQPAELKLTVACISDRGLSEKRPLNEDSFLADPERRIFAVADGVGGAESGEVASQTAVEVLDDAFQHHKSGDDPEDLMELAIQRANKSIHQLAHEHSKLSMMATTVVALYIDNDRATIGHVGDSRLYRMTPDGRIHRETADHSVVEEEVRAGRMTPQQAAHHPSRNVISRALGAEPNVEADMKVIEITPGTTFLLCSDGITRHIPDNELEELLGTADDLDALCEELKRICYERGAEDNLTAVVVRVGSFDLHQTLPGADDPHRTVPGDIEDDERTLLAAPRISQLSETAPLQETMTGFAANAASLPETARLSDEQTVENARSFTPESKPQFTAPSLSSPRSAASETTPTRSRSKVFGAMAALIIVPFIVLAAAGLAFYGGTLWERRSAPGSSIATTNPALTNQSPSTTSAAENPQVEFERRRREVDASPLRYIEQVRRNNNFPETIRDPAQLYLYGRALALSGQQADATSILRRALEEMDAKAYPPRDSMRIETLLMMAAMANGEADRIAARQQLDRSMERSTNTGTTNSNVSGRPNGSLSPPPQTSNTQLPPEQ
jgi:serine/threonine protein phosphatase PrpC